MIIFRSRKTAAVSLLNSSFEISTCHIFSSAILNDNSLLFLMAFINLSIYLSICLSSHLSMPSPLLSPLPSPTSLFTSPLYFPAPLFTSIFTLYNQVRVVFAQRRVCLTDGGGVDSFRSQPFGHPLLEVIVCTSYYSAFRISYFLLHVYFCSSMVTI